MSDEPKQKGYVGQAWLVILLALVYGGALAGVETTLGPRIAENKKRETYDVIPVLVGDVDKAKTVELLVEGKNGEQVRVYQAVAADGTHKGWVLPASGQGFADRIDLLIGLDADVSTITGLYVLDQKETPGLGNFITSEALFLSQFAGKSADEDEPLLVVKTDPATGTNQIKAVSGATISSESVSEIVNHAIANLKEPLRQRALQGAGATTSATPGPGTNVH
jgi:electron transport complex protein RnfG